jgi:hypothetical protein
VVSEAQGQRCTESLLRVQAGRAYICRDNSLELSRLGSARVVTSVIHVH